MMMNQQQISKQPWIANRDQEIRRFGQQTKTAGVIAAWSSVGVERGDELQQDQEDWNDGK